MMLRTSANRRAITFGLGSIVSSLHRDDGIDPHASSRGDLEIAAPAPGAGGKGVDRLRNDVDGFGVVGAEWLLDAVAALTAAAEAKVVGPPSRPTISPGAAQPPGGLRRGRVRDYRPSNRRCPDPSRPAVNQHAQ